MSHAPLSSLSVPASSAGGPVVAVVHACARHPDLKGEQGCTGCSAALCSACARSTAHRRCPACRSAAGEDAHVVDANWRVTLLIDALSQSFRAIPRRAPALLAVLAVALAAPLAAFAADDGGTDGDAVALAVAFGCAAFFFGVLFQPLLVVPGLAPASKLRALGGAVLSCFVAMAPLIVVGVAAVVVAGDAADDLVGQLFTIAGLFVGAVSIPLGLVWQGRAVMGRGPSLRGFVGAVVAHAVYAGLFGFVLSFAWLPIVVVVVAGYVVSPAVAGVVGVVCGLFVWLGLLTGTGSFAAASARYSADLELR